MKTGSKFVLIAAALMLMIGGGFLVFTGQSRPVPPEQLIRASLQDAELAAKNRNANGVIEVISDDFKAGVWDKKRLYAYLLRAFRQSRGTNYNVRVNEPRILPSSRGNADERLVISKMSAFYAESGEDIWGSGPLTMVMRKEARRKWLVFEEPRWRIIGIAGMPLLPEGADELTIN